MRTIIKIVVCVILVGFVLLIAPFFGLVGYSEYKISSLKEKYTNMSEPDLRRIVELSLPLVADISEERPIIDYRENDIPRELQYLEPRRVRVHERGVYISLFFMVDTGASLSVTKNKEGIWQLYGWFGEHTKKILLVPRVKKG